MLSTLKFWYQTNTSFGVTDIVVYSHAHPHVGGVCLVLQQVTDVVVSKVTCCYEELHGRELYR